MTTTAATQITGLSLPTFSQQSSIPDSQEDPEEAIGLDTNAGIDGDDAAYDDRETESLEVVKLLDERQDPHEYLLEWLDQIADSVNDANSILRELRLAACQAMLVTDHNGHRTYSTGFAPS